MSGYNADVWAEWPDGELQRWDELNEYEIYAFGCRLVSDFPAEVWRTWWRKSLLRGTAAGVHVRQTVGSCPTDMSRKEFVLDRRDYARENWPRLYAELREITG